MLSVKIKGYVVIALLVASTSLYAKHLAFKDDPFSDVLCPKISIMRQMSNKLENVEKNFNGSYEVSSSEASLFYENNVKWFIKVTVQAHSAEEALPLAKNSIKSLVYSNYVYAMHLWNTYYCSYGPENIEIIGYSV